jgi:hypothetical protein
MVICRKGTASSPRGYSQEDVKSLRCRSHVGDAVDRRAKHWEGDRHVCPDKRAGAEHCLTRQARTGELSE